MVAIRKPYQRRRLRSNRLHASISNMKSIVISIDANTLERIDRIAREAQRGRASASRKPNRSRLVRQALQEFVLRHERREREERDRRALETHRERIREQAEALVAEQADF